MEQVHLDSNELYGLWANYMSDSMSKCVLQHFLYTAQDNDVRTVVEKALRLANTHLDFITALFNQEGIKLPIAFSFNNDLNSDAPRLFTDVFYLYYLKNMTKMGLTNYSAFLSGASRSDIRDYASHCVVSTKDLFNQTVDILINKGLQIRAPQVPYPQENGYIETKHFLSGWIGEQRPLTSAETSNLFVTLQLCSVTRALFMGFSQTIQNNDARKFLHRGKHIIEKHMEVFSGFLKESDHPATVPWDTEVTGSSTQTFSDKLIMFHTIMLLHGFIGAYAISLSLSHRRDLALDYGRLTAEIGKFTIEGAELMIENRWLEKPPISYNRENISCKSTD